ncbi:MAG: tRNA glutamyl-Q(34) synthetase GluQRS [Gemmatimonadaceae bacterium]|nr:tRNA glutamyl-Q(34) synthetase GluQRS [Gemmatimonadaceae bacterium]
MTEADRAALRARLEARLPARWRTRFAPAPTGHLHLGHAVNAVYVWSIARAFGGSVILRIEDHDARRAQAVYVESIIADLRWLGLDVDNAAGGMPSPIRQSDEPRVYEAALATLVDAGGVYACRCSRREIASKGLGGDGLRYQGTCRTAGVPPDETPARRLLLPADMTQFDDLRHGPQQLAAARQCGELLLRDRLGQPTYQFAVVVDDMRHGIDVVIRGDDLLASTGRQIMLAAQLGRTLPPMFLHHPLVCHADGTKLSKSRGDVGIRELRQAGLTPGQVLGRAAWLGGLQDQPEPCDAARLHEIWTS